MKSFNREWLLAVVGVGLIFPVSAYCYIDLGTGSYILQVAIASLVGALFTLKIYWKKVVTALSKMFRKK